MPPNTRLPKHEHPPRPRCPYCGSIDFCDHFKGWTTDREMLIPLDPMGSLDLLPSDAIVATLGTLRVYRLPGG